MNHYELISELTLLNLSQDAPVFFILPFLIAITLLKKNKEIKGINGLVKYQYVLFGALLLFSLSIFERIPIYLDYVQKNTSSFKTIEGEVLSIDYRSRSVVITFPEVEINNSPYATNCLPSKFREVEVGDTLKITYSEGNKNESDCIVKIEKQAHL